MMASILWLPVIFICYSYVLYTLAVKLPPLPSASDVNDSACNISINATKIHFPSSLDELRSLSSLLSCYTHTHLYYVLALFSCAYLYKQTFAIPGSVFLNLLGGSLFGVVWAFPLTCLLTAIGASNCYLLSRFFGKWHVMNYLGARIEPISNKIEQNNDGLFLFLLSLRLFPMSPNWLMNIAAPILNIPLHMFFPSVLLGLMPYNFLCVEAGSLLSDLTSTTDILTAQTSLKLALTAAAVLVPGILLRRYQRNTYVQVQLAPVINDDDNGTADVSVQPVLVFTDSSGTADTSVQPAPVINNGSDDAVETY